MPVNLKDQDAFHLTIEEYLLALISLVEELVRTIGLCTFPGNSLIFFSRPVWLSIPLLWVTTLVHSG